MTATATTETVSETRVVLELDWDTACALQALVCRLGGSDHAGTTRSYTDRVAQALADVGVHYADYSRYRLEGDLRTGRVVTPEGSP